MGTKPQDSISSGYRITAEDCDVSSMGYRPGCTGYFDPVGRTIGELLERYGTIFGTMNDLKLAANIRDEQIKSLEESVSYWKGRCK